MVGFLPAVLQAEGTPGYAELAGMACNLDSAIEVVSATGIVAVADIAVAFDIEAASGNPAAFERCIAVFELMAVPEGRSASEDSGYGGSVYGTDSALKGSAYRTDSVLKRSPLGIDPALKDSACRIDSASEDDCERVFAVAHRLLVEHNDMIEREQTVDQRC